MQIQYNKSPRTQEIRYIVIHDTGNPGKGADADAHFQYFNSADRQSSADIFVDKNGALIVNDFHKYYTWHCGDGKGKNGITNQNSIGIEICIPQDGDYQAAVEQTVALVRQLLKELNLTADRVVRHYDASGKICPGSMAQNDWQGWKDFMRLVTESDAESVQRKAALAEETMAYLKNYTYGADLIRKLSDAMQKNLILRT